MSFKSSILGIIIIALVFGCQKDDQVLLQNKPEEVDTSINQEFKPTPYFVQVPLGLPAFPAQLTNPLTVEGVELGRKLFYDKLLSRTQTQSCGSCHDLKFALTDHGKQFSTGVGGQVGFRNSMPIFNLAYVEKYAKTNHRFFWDGATPTLEDQALAPITNPIEMDETIPNVLMKLQNHPEYPSLFKKAFGKDSITTKMLMQAIAQFERTILSGNTRFNMLMILGVENVGDLLTPQEKRGFDIFRLEEKGDCFHCHNLGTFTLTTDNSFRHNGHRTPDRGLGAITNNTDDDGKFRVPGLYNLVFTAPYMHDGRFKTLEEVVEFYNSGIVRQAPTDPVLVKHPNGLELTESEKADLVAFLKTLTDSSLIHNQNYLP